ncbi:HK97 family phage prohead protease [Priestia megaterium]|uniref:HK97 family phage prohead protease n=1 Tax=Priestia megaterium TaxID=1404 RepID=UPI002D7FD693|nr:HK97 family phage prohead protease [Priestia megaterium]MEB4861150.1 HK97 family phage prohead protease [Priestia megaterium]
MEKKQKEIRQIDVKSIETRSLDENREVVIEGYINRFNQQSEYLGFYEKVAPDAFTRSLKERENIMALYNHDGGKPLGRTDNGSLELWTDKVGLRFRLKPNMNLFYVQDVMELIKTDEVRGCSFGFFCVDDEKEVVDGVVHRTLKDVELFEVTITPDPAYLDSSVAVSKRSMEDFKNNLEQDAQKEEQRKIELELLGLELEFY